MTDAFIVEALRTAGARRGGRLAGWHPADLAGFMLDEIVARTGVDPAAIDDVLMGCVQQLGEQGMHIGRNAVLSSKLPISVPAVTLDRQCCSSQQALHFAAQAVMSGTQDLVIAAGVESMSRVPLGLGAQLAGEGAYSRQIKAKFGVQEFSQFVGARMIAQKYGFTREDLDAFALTSHQRAAVATQSGAFSREIVPVEVTLRDGTRAAHNQDEGIRFDATLQSIGAVKLLEEGGVLSAATASQICDGASAILIASEAALRQHSLTPLARIVVLTASAGDPVLMLEEPIAATRKALKRAGMRIEDMDLYEVNEAFAPVPLAWVQEIGAEPQKLNVNGGAIALGHPLGASGAKLMSTLVHALRARGLRYGLQTMCAGGGLANVTLVEALGT